MSNTPTLNEIETAIYEHYRFFAVTAPGVVVQETGDLAAWWALFDREITKEEES